MANQKSQIYPIQLQGAELNLNKFDGEIKQYSGFNKNNSPFVGGCLSNLFIKDTQITGSNSENTYVDANGDVYHVDNEGLWKNDTKILDIEGRAWCIEDLDLPENTVYYNCSSDLKTYIYVTREDINNTLKLTFIYHSAAEDFTVVRNIDIPSENPVFEIYFDSILEKKYVGFSIRLAGNQEYITGILDLSDNNKYFTIDRSVGIYTDLSFTTFDYQGEECIIIFNLVTEKSCYRWDGTRVNLDCRFHFEVTGSLFDFSAYSRPIENFVQHTKDNDYYVYRISSDDAAVGFNNRIFKTKINEIHLVNNQIYIELVYDEKSFATSIVAGSSFNSVLISGPNRVLKNYGVCYAFMSQNKRVFYGVCDFITGNVTLEGNYPAFRMGALLGSCVLVNNGIVSGLSLPGGNILVSEWNSIDGNFINIVYSGDEVIAVNYKTNDGKFRRLKITNNYTLKKVNNFLVLNVNQLKNCYRLTDGKKLLFAPAWNNRAAKDSAYCHTEEVTDNLYYMASSVNEYDLQNNASIILNPIPVVSKEIKATPVGSHYTFVSFLTIEQKQEDVFINYYSGNDEIVYQGSIDIDNKKHLLYSNLKGLPFPSNTEGNIQYSPSLFSEIKSIYGNKAFIKNGNTFYPLMIDNNNEPVLSFFIASGIENLKESFVIQGQFYGVIDNGLYIFQYLNGVLTDVAFVVSIENLQFCGNTPYEAYFFSPTNRCLYSFVGSNILQQKQFVDKISEVRNYRYNPATQSVFLFTDIGLITVSAFGMYLIERQWKDLFLREKGVTLINDGILTDLQYYDGEELDKQNIRLETCFYGMNNQTVTINDCLYVRIFSEEHEEGDLKVSATTLSLEGRKTEDTVFKIKESDWDKMTHSIYLRYQPKEQRGLGISFSIDSPFKIASLSVGSQADAVLIDKVSKGAINRPQITSNNTEW